MISGDLTVIKGEKRDIDRKIRLCRIVVVIISSLLVLFGVFSVIFLSSLAKEGVAVIANGRCVSVLDREEDFYYARDCLKNYSGIDFPFDVRLRRVKNTVEHGEFERFYIALARLQKTDETEAYAILLDGVLLGGVKTESEAERCVLDVKNALASVILTNGDIESASCEANVMYEKEASFPRSLIGSSDLISDSAVSILKRAIAGRAVREGEGFSASCLSLVISEECGARFPFRLTLRVTEKVMTPPRFVYVDSADYRVGTTALKEHGKCGTDEAEYRLVLSEGVELSREELSRRTVKEAGETVIFVGTKPLTDPYGVLFWPLENHFEVSSLFGKRRPTDRIPSHTGVDIRCPDGTPVLACDGGKVVFAGKLGSYGNLVKVDHGGGIQTWYAHLSEFAVLEGELVARGQTIAYSGHTGRAFGAHLHLEVRENGEAVDPIERIGEKRIFYNLA